MEEKKESNAPYLRKTAETAVEARADVLRSVMKNGGFAKIAETAAQGDGAAGYMLSESLSFVSKVVSGIVDQNLLSNAGVETVAKFATDCDVLERLDYADSQRLVSFCANMSAKRRLSAGVAAKTCASAFAHLFDEGKLRTTFYEEPYWGATGEWTIFPYDSRVHRHISKALSVVGEAAGTDPEFARLLAEAARGRIGDAEFAAGLMSTPERLPSVRELAATLLLHPDVGAVLEKEGFDSSEIRKKLFLDAGKILVFHFALVLENTPPERVKTTVEEQADSLFRARLLGEYFVGYDATVAEKLVSSGCLEASL